MSANTEAPAPVGGLDALLTVEQTAKHLQMSKPHVYALLREGTIPSVAIGERHVRVRVRDLQDYVLSRTRKLEPVPEGPAPRPDPEQLARNRAAARRRWDGEPDPAHVVTMAGTMHIGPDGTLRW